MVPFTAVLLDSVLQMFNSHVKMNQFYLQLICSYLFWPVAVMMGVEIEDARQVASLLGTKIFVDEFISFRDLGEMHDVAVSVFQSNRASLSL